MLQFLVLLVSGLPLLVAQGVTTMPAPQAEQPATGFLYKTITLGDETYAYSVFVPPDYTPDRTWPVILFLHGSGERGDDGFRQTVIGIGSALRWNHERVPAVVVMPQCRKDQAWVGPMGEMALRCLEKTSREYRLDPDRIYLTGLSLGGQGVWHIAATFPNQFAAVVPICGFADWEHNTEVAEKLAPRLVNLPIWVFHGDADKSVPVESERELVALIRKAGSTKIEYTEYPGVGHNAWDKAYGDPELWKWLFAQHRTHER